MKILSRIIAIILVSTSVFASSGAYSLEGTALLSREEPLFEEADASSAALEPGQAEAELLPEEALEDWSEEEAVGFEGGLEEAFEETFLPSGTDAFQAQILGEEEGNIEESSLQEALFTSGEADPQIEPGDEQVGAGGTYTIQDTGKDDYYEEIQEALNQAMGNASLTTVKIKAGTYPISYTLDIYSNTKLLLDSGAKIVATGSRFDSDYTMLRGNHVASDGKKCKEGANCPHGGYSQVENVTISGGTWDRGSFDKNTSVMNLKHGNNITIKDCTLLHAGYHFLNLTASSDVLVENVTFKDRSTSTNMDIYDPQLETIEAVHLDCASSTGKTNPPDGTPCRNITVRSCSFENVYAGVGNHHPADKDFGENILVENCSFKQIYGCALCFYGFKNARGIGNNIQGGYKAVVVKQKSEATLEGNIIRGASYFGIQVSEGCKADCYGNTITEIGPGPNKISAGISFEENTSGTLSANTLTGCHTYGILLKGEGPFEVKGNTISQVKEDGGLVLRYGSRATIQGNTIKGTAGNLMKLDEVGECLAEDNHLSDGGDNGIYVAGSSDTVTLKRNHIEGVVNHGIKVSTTDSCPHTLGYLEGNWISKAENGILFATSRGTAIGNTIWDCNGFGIHVYGATEILEILNNDIQGTQSSAICVSTNKSVSSPGMAHIKGNIAVCATSSPDIQVLKDCKNCTVEYNYIGKNGIVTKVDCVVEGNTSADQRPTPTVTPLPTSTPVPTSTPRPTSTPKPTSAPAQVTISKTKIKSLTNPSAGRVVIKWKKLKVDGYYLQYSPKKGMPEDSTYTERIEGGKVTRFTLSNMPKKTYYFRIQGYLEKEDGTLSLGPWSKVKKLKVKK